MARSGRGRGRSALSFNIEAVGFGKGEALPETVFGPPPLYPTTDFKAIPLKTGEDEDYLLALKQELRNAMRSTPYFVTRKDDDQGSVPVERYSKKYLQINEKALEWTPDWRRLPRELKPKRKVRKGGKLKVTNTAAPKPHVDVLKKIEELEEKGDEEKSDEEEKDKNKEEDGKEEESEEYDEEEHEEENDYIASYFEDGDDYGADSDENADEATY